MASPLRQNINRLATPIKLSNVFLSKNDSKLSVARPNTSSGSNTRIQETSQKVIVSPKQRTYLSPNCHVIRKHDWSTSLISPRVGCCQKILIDKAVEETEEQNENDDKTLIIDTPRKIALSSHGLNFKNHWKKLGKGSFGTVIQAKYKGEDVAVKIIPKNRFMRSLNSLKNEINALKLCHRNIVRVLQVVHTEGEYGLVFMELCSGVNLQALVTEPSFSFSTTQRARYILDIAVALQHCHNNGILHLDVKPSNIIVCTPGDFCKLCDFGSSQCFADRESFNMSISSGLNTVIYTDPLILQGKLPSEKSDIYSLGITSWQLMACEVPYRGYTLETIIYKVGCGKLRPRTLSNTTGEDRYFIQLYTRCWQQDPNIRPAICEIIKELKDITFTPFQEINSFT